MKRMTQRTTVVLFAMPAAWLIAVSAAYAQKSPSLRVERSSSGQVTFVGGQSGAAIPVTAKVAGQPPTADDFIAQHGILFGVTDPANQLVRERFEVDALATAHTTYAQFNQGVPVFAGVLKVHQDAAGQIVAANGHFFPVSPKLNVQPTLTAKAAAAIATDALSAGGQPVVDHNELVIVDPGWYGDPPIGAHLAYYVIVSVGPTIRDGF